MITRLLALGILAQMTIPTALAEELPVRRIDALRALVASKEETVNEADDFLDEPVTPSPVDDLPLAQDQAAVSVAMQRGWLLLSDRKFRPNEALSIDDALQWRLRASGLGALAAGAVDRERLPLSAFRNAVVELRQYRWTLSPAYDPGEFVSLPDARALFATVTGVLLPANPVTYPWQEPTLLAGNLLNSTWSSGLPALPPGSSAFGPVFDGSQVGITGTSSDGVTLITEPDNAWWPFPHLRVAVIDGMIQRTLGLVVNPASGAEAQVQPASEPVHAGLIASLVTGVSTTLADPWQQLQASDSVIDQPMPATDLDGNVLPSVQGLDIAKYVSNKSFAITMPSLGITDLNVEHPADATNATALLAPLQRGVGHLFSYPGEGGTALIYGHSSNYPWDVSGFATIFRQINKLKVGDLVYVTYGGTFIVYQVTSHQTIPAGDLGAVMSAGDAEELVLYTCWPPDSVDQRYLVRAVPIGIYSI